MRYSRVESARFLSRPNRFVAMVEWEGKEIKVHVKNTGRCRELLQPGNRVYLARGENPLRKTPFDLVAVEKKRAGKPDLLVNLDSQIPNDVAAEWLPQSGLFSPDAQIFREVFFGKSRLDFMVRDGDRTAYLEVKGVTLEREGVALFPDAPTQRGLRHVKELIRAAEEGMEAYLLFVIQMKEVHRFTPNRETDPAFAEALSEAEKKGVRILAVSCEVTPDCLFCAEPIPICLE